MNKNNKNIVSIEDRIPKLKEARKKKANRRLIFYMTLFFFLISIIVYLQSPLSYVKTIDIQNNTFATDEEIIDDIEIDTKTNIWTVDAAKTEDKLRENPIIEEATVTKELPWTISIDIVEKQIIGFIEDHAKFYPVLENGETLETAAYSHLNGNAPLLIGFTDKEYLSKIASELNRLPGGILDLISEVYWEPEEDNKNNIFLYMNDGFIVQGKIRDFADGMTAYPSVVSQLDPEVKGIIHVGIGVYFEAFPEDDKDKDTSKKESEEGKTDETVE